MLVATNRHVQTAAPHLRLIAFSPLATVRTPLRCFALTFALGAMGCTITSLPPAGSRADGGPVATRGTVTHEARSQLRLYRDAAGCESVQTVNRRFRLVSVRPPGGRIPRRLVLEESYDIRHCLRSESSSSEAVVTAWTPDSSTARPVFRITGRGVTGEPDGPLYRMTAQGCCGSQNLSTYFSLITGRALLWSSGPVRRLEAPEGRQSRLAGFHDTYSAGNPPEAEIDSTVIGVLFWADEEASLGRWAVHSTERDHFALEGLAFVIRGRVSTDSLVLVGPADSAGLALEVRLVAPATERRIQFRVPIRGLDLDASQAKLPDGIRLSPSR
ncbi:MAG: hypothetical protein ACKVZ0_11960 [Gemmatimonadales bacterium]